MAQREVNKQADKLKDKRRRASTVSYERQDDLD